ncbi:MAG: hypothetical protein JWM67_3163, partial [Mycobacterium sp.]|nr:hypothetical protein [Mycobacterium sp.]
MSAQPAGRHVRATTLPEPIEPRTPLRLIPGRSPNRSADHGRLPFVIGVVAVGAAVVAALLVLTTIVTRDAYRLAALQKSAKQLTVQEQVVRDQVTAAEQPAALAAAAAALGMVPGGDPSFLRLSDGAVLGAPTTIPQPTPAATVAGSPAPAAA